MAPKSKPCVRLDVLSTATTRSSPTMRMIGAKTSVRAWASRSLAGERVATVMTLSSRQWRTPAR